MWTDAGKWPYLYCTAMTGGDGTQATASTTEVGVSEWNYIDADGNYTLFPGGLIDLSGDIPGAGEWLVALVYLNQGNELASSISTAQDENIDPLTLADRQEALDNAVDLFVPIRFWVLRGGATTITNKDRLEDARIWINDRVGLGSNVRLLDGITKTVKAAGGDYTTIQDAIVFFEGGKLVTDCTIEVDEDEYDEALTITSGLHTTGAGELFIEGDTRTLAGLSYVNGVNSGTSAWAATTGYTAATSKVVPTTANGLYYRATTTGTSAGVEPAWPTTIGDTVVDNTITWLAEGVPANRAGQTNGGTTSGACQLVRSGGSNEVLTVTVATSDPDFSAWGSGDKVLVWDTSALSELTISSTLNNTITVTTSWPAGIESFGGAFTLLPNRIISQSGGSNPVTATGSGVKFQGFYFKSESPSIYTIFSENGDLIIENSAIYADTIGIFAQFSQVGSATTSLSIITDADRCILTGAAAQIKARRSTFINGRVVSSDLSFIICDTSVLTRTTANIGYQIARNGAGMEAFFCYALNASSGYECTSSGSMRVQSSFAYSCTNGIFAQYNSTIQAISASARDCTTGFRATVAGTIDARATSTLVFNNTTDYSPAPDATAATDGGVIDRS
jgi:hypothetical protein